MLGEELRLSWSMSLGSLLSSSLTLRLSELSPSPSPSHSDGESGRLSSFRDRGRERCQLLEGGTCIILLYTRLHCLYHTG